MVAYDKLGLRHKLWMLCRSTYSCGHPATLPSVSPWETSFCVRSSQRGWSCMQPMTREWVEKADGDAKVATTLWQMDVPVYDAICFHA